MPSCDPSSLVFLSNSVPLIIEHTSIIIRLHCPLDDCCKVGIVPCTTQSFKDHFLRISSVSTLWRSEISQTHLFAGPKSTSNFLVCYFIIKRLQMGLDLHSRGLALVFVPELDACTGGTHGGSPCIIHTFDPPFLKLYYVTNPCLMSNKVSESVPYMVGPTNESVTQERELLCICPGNKERRLEACSTEHGLYIFQLQGFQ